ncbi:MAG: hypothetical protein GY906_22595 [bacterium]|nr:hypothetical protein [bacterium]
MANTKQETDKAVWLLEQRCYRRADYSEASVAFYLANDSIMAVLRLPAGEDIAPSVVRGNGAVAAYKNWCSDQERIGRRINA